MSATITRGMRDYVRDGWRLGGAALAFVLERPVLKRYALISIGVVLAVCTTLEVAAVVLRREAGPIGYVLIGLVAFYGVSVMVTAVAVGMAGIVAESLEARPARLSTGWRLIARRRQAIAAWAVLDLAAGVPSRFLGGWAVNQLGVLLIGFGWGLVSFFAIPAIALTSGSPWATARASLRLVRRQWGDAVYGTVYLWVRAAVLFGLPSAVSTAVGVLLIRADRVLLGGALFVAGVSGLVLTYLLTQAARAVLTVVLYRYAESGTIYPSFPADLIEHSVRGPSSAVRRLADRLEGDRLRRMRGRILGDDPPPRRPPDPERKGDA